MPALFFGTPRKLPKPNQIPGRVAVLDLAFASEVSGGGFNRITRPFLAGLGPRLAAWVDHHDHVFHALHKHDPRFVLSTKQEHGACPEMITPELVARIGRVDSIVCHTDFDGLMSAAKWIRNGQEPYEGADQDAFAVDTRMGKMSDVATRIDRAIRARFKDFTLLASIVRHLALGLSDSSLWLTIDDAAQEFLTLEEDTKKLADQFMTLELDVPFPAHPTPLQKVAFLNLPENHARYDKTQLLLHGQKLAGLALLIDGETLSLAASFDSQIDFLKMFGLSGGMPTFVSVHRSELPFALSKLGVSEHERHKTAGKNRPR